MLETALHIGTEHTGVLWVVLASVLSFAAGVLAGSGTGSARRKAASGTANPEEGA